MDKGFLIFIGLFFAADFITGIVIDKPPRGRNHKISDKFEIYFQKLVQRLTLTGAKRYVCFPPILEEVNSGYHERVTATINSTGAKLIDFPKATSFTNQKEIFYDEVYLNDDGAEVMTDAVFEVLKADGVY